MTRDSEDVHAPSPTMVSCVDFDGLEANLAGFRQEYAGASPFPHIAIDGFLTEQVARRAISEFPAVDQRHWVNYVHVNEQKFSNTNTTNWPPTLRTIWQELSSRRFLDFLEALTGIGGLIPDETLEGAGLHQSLPGGFLNIHADFTVHPLKPNWRRRCNLLVYMNEDWFARYGGDLELWSRDMKTCERTIAPIGNRAVVFTTGSDTWHGHPEPLRCPQGRARQSLALYYYTEEERPLARSTEYRPRPGDGIKGLGIFADKLAVRAYDWVKRHGGLTDRSVARFLGGRRQPPCSSPGK